jgi:hypothetical protein
LFVPFFTEWNSSYETECKSVIEERSNLFALQIRQKAFLEERSSKNVVLHDLYSPEIASFLAMMGVWVL